MIDQALPGMSQHVTQQTVAAGIERSRILSQQFHEPLGSIDRDAAYMERHSPLFSGSDANPQHGLFQARFGDGQGELLAPVVEEAEVVPFESPTNRPILCYARELLPREPQSTLGEVDAVAGVDLHRVGGVGDGLVSALNLDGLQLVGKQLARTPVRSEEEEEGKEESLHAGILVEEGHCFQCGAEYEHCTCESDISMYAD